MNRDIFNYVETEMTDSVFIHMKHLGPGLYAVLEAELMSRARARSASIHSFIGVDRIISSKMTPNEKARVTVAYSVREIEYTLVPGDIVSGTIIGTYEGGASAKVDENIWVLVCFNSDYRSVDHIWHDGSGVSWGVGDSIMCKLTDVMNENGIVRCFATPVISQ